MPRPDIVFADEPTGALDSCTGMEILSFMRSAVDNSGQTIVMVTHDPHAASYADNILFLADGKIMDEIANPTSDLVSERDRKVDLQHLRCLDQRDQRTARHERSHRCHRHCQHIDAVDLRASSRARPERIVGMKDRSVQRMVRLESVLISVLGTVVGAALAVFTSWALIRSVSRLVDDLDLEMSWAVGRVRLSTVIRAQRGIRTSA